MRYATYQIKGHADLNFYNEKIADAAEETLADKLYDLLDKASYACNITGRSKPKKEREYSTSTIFSATRKEWKTRLNTSLTLIFPILRNISARSSTTM